MTEDNAHAAAFRKMADDIMHNAEGTFGGAIVVIPPAGHGTQITALMLDSSMDGAQFWSMLKTRCDIQIQELAAGQRTQQAFRTR